MKTLKKRSGFIYRESSNERLVWRTAPQLPTISRSRILMIRITVPRARSCSSCCASKRLIQTHRSPAGSTQGSLNRFPEKFGDDRFLDLIVRISPDHVRNSPDHVRNSPDHVPNSLDARTEQSGCSIVQQIVVRFHTHYDSLK